METRIAVISIIVYDNEASVALNALLHDYAQYVIGRMGVPYKEKSVSVISVALDAPQDIIGALAGKIGQIPDISVKTVYAKV